MNAETYYLVAWSDCNDAEMAKYKLSVVTTEVLQVTLMVTKQTKRYTQFVENTCYQNVPETFLSFAARPAIHRDTRI